MNLPATFFAWAGGYAGALALWIVLSLRIEPRVWIQDLPERLKALVPPKTPAEKRLTLVFGIPMILWILFAPGLSALSAYRSAGLGEPSFLVLLAWSYGMNVVFNLVDLVVIDWGVVCTWTPRFVIVAPLTPADAKDYGYHGRAFLKGFVVLVPASVLSSAIAFGVGLLTAQVLVPPGA